MLEFSSTVGLLPATLFDGTETLHIFRQLGTVVFYQNAVFLFIRPGLLTSRVLVIGLLESRQSWSQ